MDNELEIIKEKFKTLPADVQRAILALDFRKKLQEATVKHRLHVDQAGALENETLFIMLGLEHPKDYVRNVVRELNVDAETAKKIAMDVNEQIFRPIRESLKKIHGIGDENQEARSMEQEAGTQDTRYKIQNTNKAQDTEYQIPDAKPEEPSLRLKRDIKPFTSEERLGWPLRQAQGEPFREERSAEQGMEQPTTNNQQPTTEKEKTFFKITPRAEEIRSEARDKIQETNWKPRQPDKEAPAPENLPVASSEEKIPSLGEYPAPQNIELRSKNYEARSTPEETRYKRQETKQFTTDDRQTVTVDKPPKEISQTSLGAIQEKLTGVVKLPRTETEYEATEKSSAPPRGEAGGDPYREPIE